MKLMCGIIAIYMLLAVAFAVYISDGALLAFSVVMFAYSAVMYFVYRATDGEKGRL